MKSSIHYNKPQLRSILIGAPNEVFIAGRGTGKTTGVLAPKTAQCYLNTMPRSTGVLLNATFTQAFTRTLKELIRGWQSLGYKHEQHFLVGVKPTEKWRKKWKWKGPYAPPFDYKYFVSWYNGAVAQIVSQERVGGANGISIDWIAGDEAKLLNEDKFKTELLPANRGVIHDFANNPYHHGITLTTDMPTGTSGRWLLDRIDAMDRNVVNDIWNLQTIRFKLLQYTTSNDVSFKRKIDKQISIVDEEIKSLRKNLLYYHEASTLDNIHALGIDYIKQQIRDTSAFQFKTQILNIRPLRLEDGFYPDLDEDYHGYFSEDDGYFDRQSINYENPLFDCRKDSDLNLNEALHIAIDYNRRIHPIVVGQDDGAEIKVINNIHSLYPGKLRAALQLFCDYYKHHKEKIIYYWYDHTAVGGENETSKCDEVVSFLEDKGWTVIRMYMGKAPSHESKYRMWGHLLSEDGYYNRKFRVNRENGRYLLVSMGMAEAEQRSDGFGKEKKSERDPKFPAEESTHYSDAADQLLYGILESGLNYDIGKRSGVNVIFTH